MALFNWARPPSTARERQDVTNLRKELQAEHARLVINLRTGHDRLAEIKRLDDTVDVDPLLLNFKALVAMVERENFATMALERMPVVIAQVTRRLERLGRQLSVARRATPSSPPMVVH
jgi:hypothetical protein